MAMRISSILNLQIKCAAKGERCSIQIWISAEIKSSKEKGEQKSGDCFTCFIVTDHMEER